ncbi:MAG: GNAT family N-acetyltransferase [Defluviitaleaceae bacterium]|nr:GNAT family N-acetyltransferase [Defluviitaleaceae bacterium]
MKIEFREIDKTNFGECVNLKVGKDQEDFVASNSWSLLQAAYEPNIYPLGIYKDDKMVGFILYDFDYELLSWCMSRFMIDKDHQNQGIGARALEKFIEMIVNKHGVKRLYTSANVANDGAIALYEKFGFKKGEPFEYEVNGKTYREIQMALHL